MRRSRSQCSTLRARAMTIRVRGGADGGAPTCGPRRRGERGRGARGWGFECTRVLLPPSSSLPTVGSASVLWIAHHTIQYSPPIGISCSINQMKVQAMRGTLILLPVRERRRGVGKAGQSTRAATSGVAACALGVGRRPNSRASSPVRLGAAAASVATAAGVRSPSESALAVGDVGAAPVVCGSCACTPTARQ
jgi:hypothetical protein